MIVASFMMRRPSWKAEPTRPIRPAAGSTSFDELAYEKGTHLWLIVAGCSASCYDENQTNLTQIVNSVRVGTSA
ncbi:MAG: hypothetical protein ABSA91_11905 [Acidimicrobiales bacterium]|jgi:hypothetical protein